MNSIESKVAFLHDFLTPLSILDQILWEMYWTTPKPPPIVSSPIVDRLALLPAYPSFDRFGTINRVHLLLVNVPHQKLTAEQRQCRDCHSFHPPLSAVGRRFSSLFTSGQCHPRLQL